MRIAVQASDLDHDRIDGTRVYLMNMLERFGNIAPETEFYLYHKNTFNPVLAPPNLPNYRIEKRAFPFAWMQTRFAWELFMKRPEKLFLPIQAAPALLPASVEVTATIHDLAFKRFPETFPPALLFKLNFMLSIALKQADKIIAVSQSTKDDLLEFFPELTDRDIRVIHHGFDGEFFGVPVAAAETESVLTRHELTRHAYFLYVGALQPRKNLERLIRAFDRAKHGVPEMKLVLAGEPAWYSEKILAAREGSARKKDIILTGRATFEELRVLYQNARFFVFPSLYEGFGLPLLEAFAAGTPVLTAANSSLMEVAGKAALYCNAQGVEDMSGKLERLWDDAELRQMLIERGKQQLQKFSWDICARETLKYILE